MIERQIPEFDVLYENFRPGVMDRLGLSYERCERGAQPAHHLRVGHGIWAGRSAHRTTLIDRTSDRRSTCLMTSYPRTIQRSGQHAKH